MGRVFMESEGKKRLIRVSVWVAVLSMLLAVVASLATALEASAHAALRSMSPAAGSTVTTAPTQVVLTFNEPISTSFATVTVTDGKGAPVASGRPVVSGETVTQELAQVGSGRYSVAFRVVSEDGHPVSQKVTFTVQLPAETASAPATTQTSPTSTTPSSGVPTPTSSAAGLPVENGDSGTPSVLALGIAAVALAAAATGALAWQKRRHSGE